MYMYVYVYVYIYIYIYVYWSTWTPPMTVLSARGWPSRGGAARKADPISYSYCYYYYYYYEYTITLFVVKQADPDVVYDMFFFPIREAYTSEASLHDEPSYPPLPSRIHPARIARTHVTRFSPRVGLPSNEQ